MSKDLCLNLHKQVDQLYEVYQSILPFESLHVHPFEYFKSKIFEISEIFAENIQHAEKEAEKIKDKNENKIKEIQSLREKLGLETDTDAELFNNINTDNAWDFIEDFSISDIDYTVRMNTQIDSSFNRIDEKCFRKKLSLNVDHNKQSNNTKTPTDIKVIGSNNKQSPSSDSDEHLYINTEKKVNYNKYASFIDTEENVCTDIQRCANPKQNLSSINTDEKRLGYMKRSSGENHSEAFYDSNENSHSHIRESESSSLMKKENKLLKERNINKKNQLQESFDQNIKNHHIVTEFLNCFYERYLILYHEMETDIKFFCNKILETFKWLGLEVNEINLHDKQYILNLINTARSFNESDLNDGVDMNEGKCKAMGDNSIASILSDEGHNDTQIKSNIIVENRESQNQSTTEDNEIKSKHFQKILNNIKNYFHSIVKINPNKIIYNNHVRDYYKIIDSALDFIKKEKEQYRYKFVEFIFHALEDLELKENDDIEIMILENHEKISIDKLFYKYKYFVNEIKRRKIKINTLLKEIDSIKQTISDFCSFEEDLSLSITDFNIENLENYKKKLEEEENKYFNIIFDTTYEELNDICLVFEMTMIEFERTKESLQIMKNLVVDLSSKKEIYLKCLSLILERENLKIKMIEFEKSASDPKRLFKSSFQLIKEEKFRKNAYPNLLKIENNLMQEINNYEKDHGDFIYKGEKYPQILDNDIKNRIINRSVFILNKCETPKKFK